MFRTYRTCKLKDRVLTSVVLRAVSKFLYIVFVYQGWVTDPCYPADCVLVHVTFAIVFVSVLWANILNKQIDLLTYYKLV